MLASFEGKPFKIVCVGGAYRGGKSYFASLLFGTTRDDIFDLGHTVQSQTAGIWCALQDRGDYVLMVVDCEGTDAALGPKGTSGRDAKYDLKLLTILSLLGSTLVVNVSGKIDRSTLEQLNAVAGIVQLLRASSDASLAEDSKEVLVLRARRAECAVNGVLPELVVLVRDFELGLPDGIRNPNDYFDSTLALEAVDEDDDDAKEKMAANKIKKSVMECFPKHQCFTLPHPLHGAGAGASIHHLGTEHGKVSVDFRRQVADVVRTIVTGARDKKLQDKVLDGGLLNAMLDSIVRSLNESDIVSIPDMWTTMVARAAEEAVEKARDVFYEHGALKGLESVLPLEESEVRDRVHAAFDAALASLGAKPTEILEPAQRALKKLFEGELEHASRLNLDASREVCSKLADHLLPARDSVCSAASTLEDARERAEQFVEQLKRSARGPCIQDLSTRCSEWVRTCVEDVGLRLRVKAADIAAKTAQMAAEQAAEDRAAADKRVADAEKALEVQRKQAEEREKALLEAKRKEIADAEAAQAKERAEFKKRLDDMQSLSVGLGGARYSVGGYCGDMARATPRYMCPDFDMDCSPRARRSFGGGGGSGGFTPSGQQIHTGPRGGHFVYTRTGNKRYV